MGLDSPPTEATSASMPAPAGPGRDTGGPPPVSVRGPTGELNLAASSFCWSGCADGRPPDPLPEMGDAAELEVAFPVPGWRFAATAVPHGQECGRHQTVPLEPTGPVTFRLRPIGAAGDYDISLFGTSTGAAPQRGDLSVTFRWRTRRNGPNVPPAATASIVAGQPPEVHSFGVEVDVTNLRATPRPGRILATAVVTSAGGAPLRIDLQRLDRDCQPEGSVHFVAGEEWGRLATRLGRAPFRYEVTLVIDTVTYRGTATWPDDVDPECSPCTPLRFAPPLPGL